MSEYEENLRNSYIEVMNGKPRGFWNKLQAVGEMVADGIIAKAHLQKMKTTNAKLIEKYGSGSADGTDDYYHPLLQCQLARISDQSMRNGIMLGYGKEVYDYNKKIKTQPYENVVADERKDLQNNLNGSKIGYINRLKSCLELLDDKRTQTMRDQYLR